ncbi:hypothetical protein [Roseibium album]|uniref:hypothetical protein n=1 Tax=Roseibium album TaxID=311410 RepID=UPI00249064C0|nr:hypothetical protein [Roseibium album]
MAASVSTANAAIPNATLQKSPALLNIVLQPCFTYGLKSNHKIELNLIIVHNITRFSGLAQTPFDAKVTAHGISNTNFFADFCVSEGGQDGCSGDTVKFSTENTTFISRLARGSANMEILP